MKAVFWLGIMVLMQTSRLRFKQSRISMLIPHIYVLGRFVNFLVTFRYIGDKKFFERISEIYPRLNLSKTSFQPRCYDHAEQIISDCFQFSFIIDEAHESLQCHLHS